MNMIWRRNGELIGLMGYGVRNEGRNRLWWFEIRTVMGIKFGGF